MDELHKQIALNNEYQNQIKKDIEDQMPFISELKDSQEVINEFIDSKFEESLKLLLADPASGGRGYKHIRRLRRDGNCFYRAFLFQLFEHYALNFEKEDPTISENYAKLVSKIEGCKKDMMEHGGYDEIVIDDFYDMFLDNLKKLATLKDDFAAQSEAKTYPEFVH